jgi:hypothetical protein
VAGAGCTSELPPEPCPSKSGRSGPQMPSTAVSSSLWNLASMLLGIAQQQSELQPVTKQLVQLVRALAVWCGTGQGMQTCSPNKAPAEPHHSRIRDGRTAWSTQLATSLFVLAKSGKCVQELPGRLHVHRYSNAKRPPGSCGIEAFGCRCLVFLVLAPRRRSLLEWPQRRARVQRQQVRRQATPMASVIGQGGGSGVREFGENRLNRGATG